MLIECLLITIISGVLPLVDKYVLNLICEETLLLLTIIITFITAIIYFSLFYKDKIYNDLIFLKNNKYLYLILLLSSLTFFFFVNIRYVKLLKNNSPYLIIPIMSIYPLFTVLAGYLLYKHTITYIQFMGIIFIIIGVYMINVKK